MKSSARNRRRKSSRQWVVEIGTAHVAAGLFSGAGDDRTLEQLRHIELVPGNGEAAADRTGLEAALREMQAELGIKGEVVLVVPGHLALTKQVRVPVVAEAQRSKLIEFEVKQGIPFDLEQVYWAHAELGTHAGEREVMIVAAKTDGIDRLLQRCSTAGIVVRAVVAAGPTLRSIGPVSDQSKALISVGARSTHLVFTHHHRVHLRTLTLAGNSVTQDIANRLNQSFAEAEQLKLGVLTGEVALPADTPAGAAVQEAAAGFSARLKLELSRTLVTQVRPAGIAPPHIIEVAGGGAGGLAKGGDLGAGDAATVAVWSLPAELKTGSSAQAELSRVGAGRFTDLVGAYFAGDEDGGVELDLAPPRMREARAAKRQRPRWLIAAGLLVVATLLPGLHFNRLAAARLSAATQLQRQAVPVQALRDQATEHLAELERLRESAGVWQERLRSRQAWEGLMGDLQSSLTATGDVWLERLHVLPLVDSAEADPRLRLRISGRLLDRENPLSRVSQNAYQRATSLLEGFVESPRIAAIEGERFDASEPGMLRFDFTLVINPRSGL